MINLTFYAKDFNRLASWDFFAAGHGKSPCDGIGGTTKQCLIHKSLCHPTENHILTAEDAFEFCKDNILGIQYIFLDSEGYVEPKRLFMKSHRPVTRDPIAWHLTSLSMKQRYCKTSICP